MAGQEGIVVVEISKVKITRNWTRLSFERYLAILKKERRGEKIRK